MCYYLNRNIECLYTSCTYRYLFIILIIHKHDRAFNRFVFITVRTIRCRVVCPNAYDSALVRITSNAQTQSIIKNIPEQIALLLPERSEAQYKLGFSSCLKQICEAKMFLSRRATKRRQAQRNRAPTIDFGVRRLHFRLFLKLIRKVQFSSSAAVQQQFSRHLHLFSDFDFILITLHVMVSNI